MTPNPQSYAYQFGFSFPDAANPYAHGTLSRRACLEGREARLVRDMARYDQRSPGRRQMGC